MAYDRADSHYGGDFPDGLPPENGATHIGMYLSWAIRRGLAGQPHVEHSAAALAAVRDGRTTGRSFFIEQCDEKLTAEDLNDEGNRFTVSYYDRYLEDYSQCFGGEHASLYEVADSQANQRRVDALLDRRLTEWRQNGSVGKKPWWRFW